MKKIKIGKKIVAAGSPCFIIAEAGINHNGSLLLAKKLVAAAARAGADAVKFQTFKAEDVVTAAAPLAGYQKNNSVKPATQLKMLRQYELPEKSFIVLKKYCDKKKIIFLSTPHSLPAVTLLNRLVPAYKISSADLTNGLLLDRAARTKKPILLSTGMATLREIKNALRIIRRTGNNKIVLLHCTSQYPCPFDQVDLRAMTGIKKATDCPVGYSDHTPGWAVSLAAAALGAVIVEKHFTLDRTLPGPDHKASIEPAEMAGMISAIRNVEQALGSPRKSVTAGEKKMRAICRKSIVALTDIARGEIISADKVGVKRPGTGIAPDHYQEVAGSRARKPIKKDSLIQWTMLCRKKRSKQ